MQEIFTYIIVLVCFAFAVLYFYRKYKRIKNNKKSCTDCTNNCDGCAIMKIKNEKEKSA